MKSFALLTMKSVCPRVKSASQMKLNPPTAAAISPERSEDFTLRNNISLPKAISQIPQGIYFVEKKHLLSQVLFFWRLLMGSNQRHVDFQSTALPTELQRHLEQSITLCSDAFFGDPERTRTVDLQRDRLAC